MLKQNLHNEKILKQLSHAVSNRSGDSTWALNFPFRIQFILGSELSGGRILPNIHLEVYSHKEQHDKANC